MQWWHDLYLIKSRFNFLKVNEEFIIRVKAHFLLWTIKWVLMRWNAPSLQDERWISRTKKAALASHVCWQALLLTHLCKFCLCLLSVTSNQEARTVVQLGHWHGGEYLEFTMFDLNTSLMPSPWSRKGRSGAVNPLAAAIPKQTHSWLQGTNRKANIFCISFHFF